MMSVESATIPIECPVCNALDYFYIDFLVESGQVPDNTGKCHSCGTTLRIQATMDVGVAALPPPPADGEG